MGKGHTPSVGQKCNFELLCFCKIRSCCARSHYILRPIDMYNNGGMYGGMGMGGMGPGMGGMNMGMGMSPQGGFGGGRAMGGMGGMGRGGGGRSMGLEDGVSTGRREEFVQGKLFLGGLDNATTKDTLLNYCRQWCV